MSTAIGRISITGNGEAVLLPKEVAFGKEMDVTIVRTGDILTIHPKMPMSVPRDDREAERPTRA